MCVEKKNRFWRIGLIKFPSRKKWFLAQTLTLFAIAETAPTDVLDRNTWLKYLSKPVVTLLPNVASYIGASQFPQVAELVLSLGWYLVIPNFLVLMYAFQKGHVTIESIKEANSRANVDASQFRWALLFFIVAIPIAILAILFYPIDWRIETSTPITALEYSLSSRTVFGLMGQALSNFIGSYLALWFLFYRLYLDSSRNRD